MAAISKSWVTIADAAVDPDSPVDTTLMEGIRDDLVHLREWVGASFFAGAVQDHNHDGANSALIEVGPNLLRNGSFENDGAGWTITDYTGGSHAFSTSVRHHGEKSLSFTSTSTANGGGDALSNEFIPVAEGRVYQIEGIVSASGANVSSRAQVVWYDDAQSQISAVTVFDTTNTSTAARRFGAGMEAPVNARFARVKLIGGVPGAGSATGTIYFDNILFQQPLPLGERLAGGVITGAVATLDIPVAKYGVRFRNLRLLFRLFPATDSVNLFMRVSIDGGSSFLASTQYNHTVDVWYDDGGAVTRVATNGGNNIALAGNDIGSDSKEGVAGHVDVFDFADDGNVWKLVKGETVFQNAGATLRAGGGSTRGTFRGVEDITDLRLLFQTGNIAKGFWSLYGWN